MSIFICQNHFYLQFTKTKEILLYIYMLIRVAVYYLIMAPHLKHKNT